MFRNCQKAKLRSILQYFEFLENESALEGRMVVSRQVKKNLRETQFYNLHFLT